MSLRASQARSWTGISLACRFLLCSILVGAFVTVGMCWMAAWDEFTPSPKGLAQYRFVDDAYARGSGESGEWRPGPLRWWDAVTPLSWHVGPRVWADGEIAAERAANPEVSGEAQDEQRGHWCATWRPGPGLSDSFVVRRSVFVASAAARPDERERSEMNNYVDFGGKVRIPTRLPLGLAGRGTPECAAFSADTLRAWEDLTLPGWAVLHGGNPEGAIRIDSRLGEQDRDISRRAEWHAGGVATEEVRAYGWPIRSLLVNGWRRDLEWHNEAGFDQGDTNEWWSDGLRNMQPLRTPVSMQLALPATGLPWQPLWFPFLANSLILGAPLTLAGIGVSRSVRWGFSKFRGRGCRCAHCGYSRTGLARGAACPECGRCESVTV